MRYVPKVVFAMGLLLSTRLCGGTGERPDLNGTWDDVTPKPPRVGYRVPRSPRVLVFSRDVCTWTEGAVLSRQSLFTPVGPASDKAIDFVTVVEGKFWTTHALYALDGDTLTIREGALNEPRPTSLIS